MILSELVLRDLTLNQIYEPIKFAALQRYPDRVRKTADDGITATVQLLNIDDSVRSTIQYSNDKHIWQVNP